MPANCTFNQNPFGVANEDNIGSHRLVNRPTIDTKNLEPASKDDLDVDHLEDQNEVIVQKRNKILSYMSQSSLFIFHKDSVVR